jgi:formiminoglutamate deiminase
MTSRAGSIQGERGMNALWFRSALLEKGWAANVRIVVDAGRIASIEPATSAELGDERHEIALPGMPNLHSHAFQRAMAGLAETAGPRADNFWTWREAMYRFLDAIGPAELEAITAFAFMEMLESGFTRVGEFHYVHHDPDGRAYANPGELSHRVAAASREADIGLTLLPVMYAHSNFAGLPPTHGQRRFINRVDDFARIVAEGRRAIASLDEAVMGVAPHSLRAVTPEELRESVALVPDGPIHIHAAEQVKEVEDCLDWCGQRPVEWLLDHAPLDERWCVVHATHITADETRRLAGSGAVAGLCPVTEANLGDGVFPTPAYLEAEGAIGVGSDSNILISPAEELRMLEYAQRLHLRSRNVLASTEQRSTGRRLFEAALAGGSRALGSAAQLKAGAPADIVTLDANHPSLAGRRGDEILDSWIFAGRGGVVDCVWRQGRKVVASGQHVARGRITMRYRQTLSRSLGA